MSENKESYFIGPYVDGLFRSIIGLILGVMLISYVDSDILSEIIVLETPITYLAFLGYVMGGAGLLFSGWSITLMVEILFLGALYLFRRFPTSSIKET